MPTVKEWKDLLSKESDIARLYLNGVELTPDQLQIKLPHVETPIEMPVTDFGLKSDGSDNRKILQDLINDYAKRGDKLTLPQGRFCISDELLIPSNTFIEGYGDKTEIFLSDGNKDNRRALKVVKDAYNVKLVNLVVNGNRVGQKGKKCGALFVNDTTGDLYFEKVKFLGGRNIGTVQVKGVALDVRVWIVKNVTFLNCKFGDAGSHNLELWGVERFKIRGCEFTDYGLDDNDPIYGDKNWRSPSLKMQSVPCRNGRITGNVWNNTAGTQFAIESSDSWMYNILISNNQFNDPKNLGGNGISGYFQFSTVSLNKFKGGVGQQRSGIELFGQNDVEDNEVENGNIVVDAGNQMNGIKDVVQKGVYVLDNKVASSAVNAAALVIAGTPIVALDEVIVRGNTFDSSKGSGNAPAAHIGAYGGKSTKITNVSLEENILTANPDNSVVRLEAGTGSDKVVVRNNKMPQGHSPANYKTDNITNLEFYGNDVQTKQKDFFYSVKATKQVKLQ